MIAFPGMLVGACQEAGIKVPADPDLFDRDEFPHFFIFCAVQLGRRMARLNEHWDNAKVIAAIPESELKTITLEQMLAKGLEYCT